MRRSDDTVWQSAPPQYFPCSDPGHTPVYPQSHHSGLCSGCKKVPYPIIPSSSGSDEADFQTEEENPFFSDHGIIPGFRINIQNVWNAFPIQRSIPGLKIPVQIRD